MIDAVLGVDTNPLMGGVAAFNHQLAQRLGVPVMAIGQQWHVTRHPLVSVKASGLPLPLVTWNTFSVFWHAGHVPGITAAAARVFAANAELAEQIRPIRPDVITAHCPGLITNRGAFPQSDITVFCFGMAHKLRIDLFHRLKELIDATRRTYTLYLSAGLHTGARVVDDPFLALEQLFGDRLIFLGILSDRAVAHYLATCTYVACFFEKGVRENNTTVNAALDVGAMVLTNHDDWTPGYLREMTYNVMRLDAAQIQWPHRSLVLPKPHTWDRLLEKLR